MLKEALASLRSLFEELRDGNYDIALEDLKDLLFYNAYYRVKSLITMLDNFFFWGYNLRDNKDYDSHSMYQLIYLKADRLHKHFLKYGHCIWNASEDTKGMRKLREVYYLAKSLHTADGFYNSNLKTVMTTYTCPRHSKKSSIFNSLGIADRYKDNKLISDKLYSFYTKAAMKKDENIRKQKQKRLFVLLEKHLDSFWD